MKNSLKPQNCSFFPSADVRMDKQLKFILKRVTYKILFLDSWYSMQHILGKGFVLVVATTFLRSKYLKSVIYEANEGVV